MGATAAQTITNVAGHFGIDPALALACAWLESEINPTAKGDYELNGVIVAPGTPGSVPTSFGAYQLHRGGELGNLTPAEAFDLATCATVALGQFASTKAQNPSLASGALAAAAQRPANPEQYAADVNEIIASIHAGTMGPLYAERCAAVVGVKLPFPPPPAPAPRPPADGSPTPAELGHAGLVPLPNVADAETALRNGWTLYYWSRTHFVPEPTPRPGVALFANGNYRSKRP